MNWRQFFKKAIAQAEAQDGWQVKRIKKGVQLLPADKTQDPVTLHETPSDHRALRNAQSRLRKAGLDI